MFWYLPLQNGFRKTGQRGEQKSPKHVEEKIIPGVKKTTTVSTKPVVFLPQILSYKIVKKQTSMTNIQNTKQRRMKRSKIIVPNILSFETESKKNLSKTEQSNESGSSVSLANSAEQLKEECSLRALALRNQNVAQVCKFN